MAVVIIAAIGRRSICTTHERRYQQLVAKSQIRCSHGRRELAKGIWKAKSMVLMFPAHRIPVVVVLNRSLNALPALVVPVKCLCLERVVGGGERKDVVEQPESRGREGNSGLLPYDA
ncbi:hypothetical protein K443DRAFT_444605 [Laccaria amethystina LaAM-08-1]|uniref:Uncharacterized protein n=1 Tax=Laccaria amethystina LaAM-08-1 TaxID=1095629 RepID=A0A0C9WNR7_9AGAR|nr:hypothetical protein K443DRAFT_444605 [Laccaria amethystina LaAM-08-1]